MGRNRSNCRSRAHQPRRRQSLLAVGVALGLMLLAPCAVQQLGGSRAAQSENNEYEVSERAHYSVQPTRRVAKSRRLRADEARLLTNSPRIIISLRRAASERVLAVPGVVSWSPSMRC